MAAPATSDDAAASFAVEDLPQIVTRLRSDETDAAERCRLVRGVRRMLCDDHAPPIGAVIDAGLVPLLVQELDGSRADVQLLKEAAWAVTNIASGRSEHSEALVHHGAIPRLAALLTHASAEVAEQAVWAIGNLAGDGANLRNMCLGYGCLSKLCELLASSAQISTTIMRSGTWCLANLCRGKPQPPLEAVAPALPTLATLVYSSDTEVLVDACWAISYISSGPDVRIQAVIAAGVVRRLVELLAHPSASVVSPALRAVGNIATGTDLQTQTLIASGGVAMLATLLTHHKTTIRKEACWTISNVAAGNAEQVKTLIEANVFPALIVLLESDHVDVRKEALWCVSNATESGGHDAVAYLIENGAIQAMASVLSGGSDTRRVLVVLDGWKNMLSAAKNHLHNLAEVAGILAECGGLRLLESLQSHSSSEIAASAREILTQCSNTEEDEGKSGADEVPGLTAGVSEMTVEAAGGGGGGGDVTVAPPPVPVWAAAASAAATPTQHNDGGGDTEAGPESDGSDREGEEDENAGLGGDAEFVF